MLLLHDFRVAGNLEWRLCFACDFVNCNALSVLDEGEALCELNIEHGLRRFVSGFQILHRHRFSLTNSVMIMLTQALPVKGMLHCFKIFGLPFLFVLPGFDTRSIAPPKPLTLPGNIQFVRSPLSLTAWRQVSSRRSYQL